MEDYSIYIYLAFALISLVAGGFKKLKEKQENKQEGSQADFEDETLFEQDLKQLVLQKEQREKEDAKASAHLERLAYRESKFKNRASSSKSVKKVRKSEQEAIEEYEDYFDGEFDAKKAVIYSEIINPPYL